MGFLCILSSYSHDGLSGGKMDALVRSTSQSCPNCTALQHPKTRRRRLCIFDGKIASSCRNLQSTPCLAAACYLNTSTAHLNKLFARVAKVLLSHTVWVGVSAGGDGDGG